MNSWKKELIKEATKTRQQVVIKETAGLRTILRRAAQEISRITTENLENKSTQKQEKKSASLPENSLTPPSKKH